ncbi:bZIP transcription factor 44-like [Cucurbita pepo subsp. pepo]|uniref:bZIP transcription factor 44-like n=1 Tax=Cucurbita pepo subsp. pepo TaxID=3664 RepID=UPI000C9D6D13|nr:bZIP transcription factor 44-like [Cucurbita pepo subsp. pepo]
MASTVGSPSKSLSSDEDLRQIVDPRKRKRMISNRESARRSRMRKQKQLDDLTSQASLLKTENEQIAVNFNFTTQLYLNLEAENSVLRAQMAELRHRLDSLNEIISFIKSSTRNLYDCEEHDEVCEIDGVVDSWGIPFLNQPIMAAGDMFMC